MKKLIALVLLVCTSTAHAAQPPKGLFYVSDVQIGQTPVKRGQQYQVETYQGDYYQWFIEPMPRHMADTHKWCQGSKGWVDNISSYDEIAGCVKVQKGRLQLQLFHPNRDRSGPFEIQYADHRKITLLVKGK
jgi:hypothetical protein